MIPPYEYKATLVRVIDGDTVDAIIDLGFGIMFGNDRAPQRLRFAGIDTPELNSKDPAERVRAEEAKQFVIDAFADSVSPFFMIKTIKTAAGKERQTFGRFVAKIYVEAEEGVWQCLNELLVSEGLAVESKW